MPHSVEWHWEFEGDRELFERLSKGHRGAALQTFTRAIGEYGVGMAVGRLSSVLKAESEVRTGNLAASLTVFEATPAKAVWGSNLAYAAQVQFGGIIRPREMQALAIPLVASLARQKLWPRDIDPSRDLLKFIPYTGSKPNVIGLLINPERELEGRERKPRGNIPGVPVGPLYALAYWVTQEARPYCYIDEEDKKEIAALYADWKRDVGT